MGAYCVATDLRKHFKKIDTSGLNQTDLEYYIALAEAEINGRLAVRYSVPFSPTPPIIKLISIECSFLYVMDRFLTGEIPKSVVSRTDWRMVRRERIDEMIDSIAKGDILIVDSDGNVIDPKNGVGDIFSTTENYPATMNMLDETLQKISTSRLDNEENGLD